MLVNTRTYIARAGVLDVLRCEEGISSFLCIIFIIIQNIPATISSMIEGETKCMTGIFQSHQEWSNRSMNSTSQGNGFGEKYLGLILSISWMISIYDFIVTIDIFERVLKWQIFICAKNKPSRFGIGYSIRRRVKGQVQIGCFCECVCSSHCVRVLQGGSFVWRRGFKFSL